LGIIIPTMQDKSHTQSFCPFARTRR
jgi:hypothetical protein